MKDGAFEPTRTALVNGASLAYRERGEGEPLVLVHGSASDMRTWAHQLRSLSKSFRTIAYSRRYAWPNEPIPETAGDPMAPHVDDLLALLRQLHAAPAHLVGHSWGGFVSLLAAMQHPEAVRSLVLMEPPVLSLFVSTPPRAAELVKTFARRPRTALAILRFGMTAAVPAEKAYRRGDDLRGFELFARGVLGKHAFERLSAERRQQALDNLAVDKAQLLGEGFPPLLDDEVRTVAQPTLLLHSEQSPPLFRLLADRLEELLPNVHRAEIPGASHIMHEDNPAAVTGAILGFTRAHGERDASNDVA
jgi:pimeloyl-ACP methyl ester carboxylesterase